MRASCYFMPLHRLLQKFALHQSFQDEGLEINVAYSFLLVSDHWRLSGYAGLHYSVQPAEDVSIRQHDSPFC